MVSPCPSAPAKVGAQRATAAMRRAWLLLIALALVYVALAMMRPLDHDESQYVASAVLSAHRLLPYRDYGWFQTPLHPLAFSAVAAIAREWTWPALRIVDAALGAGAVGLVYAAARAGGARAGAALAAAGLMGCCDALLFGAGTARNDALPLACLSAALWLAMLQEREATRLRALGLGLSLAAAAAAKLPYLLPLVAYLVMAIAERRRLPRSVLAGVLPIAVLVAGVVWQAPATAWFGIWTFPHIAPGLWYGTGSWRMSLAAKLVDAVKFLALGPALVALAAVARHSEPARAPTSSGRLVTVMLGAGLLAALAPSPTFRQYLVPALPPLFLALALAWSERPPTRAWRLAAAAFAIVGLGPSALALVSAATDGPAMARAMRDGAAIRAGLDRAHVAGPVATLSPQFLPATGRLPDPRFVPGPFYFRARGLLDPEGEARVHLVSVGRLDTGLAVRPEAILVGGEGEMASGEPALDAALAAWASAHGYRATSVADTGFTLYVGPR